MDFELKILGSSSATPTAKRNHTAQILAIGNQLNLIDCGEGTQMQLMRYKIKHQRICNIFISHLHGDHFFGLFGLLATMHLQGRTDALNIFGPPGLSEILTTQFRYSHTTFTFPINLSELDTSVHKKIYEDQFITVHTLPLDHRISCCGFLFREKPKPRRLIKEKLPLFLTPPQLVKLKYGENIIGENGEVLVENKLVTYDPKNSRTYAYCSDTRYSENLIPLVKGVDLLYHEATFMHEHAERAQITFHSTTKQAATIAHLASVKNLIIGHFSSRYKDLVPLLNEAKETFEDTFLATEGQTFTVKE